MFWVLWLFRDGHWAAAVLVPEQPRFYLNTLSGSTKEMAPSSRADGDGLSAA